VTGHLEYSIVTYDFAVPEQHVYGQHVDDWLSAQSLLYVNCFDGQWYACCSSIGNSWDTGLDQASSGPYYAYVLKQQ
jgi:hypothetical protein